MLAFPLFLKLIAMIRGYCIGGGMNIAVGCDMRKLHAPCDFGSCGTGQRKAAVRFRVKCEVCFGQIMLHKAEARLKHQHPVQVRRLTGQSSQT